MPIATVTRQAKDLVDNGRFDDALRMLERHLAAAEDDHVARNLLAYTHFKMGDYAAAEGQYRIMVAQPNPDPRDLFSLARALEAQGKTAQAEVWKAAALTADPRVAVQFHAKAPPHTRKAAAAPGPSSSVSPAVTRKPHRSPVPGPTVPPVIPQSELGIPDSDEALEIFTERLRARAKKDFMTEHWHRYPWAVRIFQMVLFVIFVAIWVIVIAGYLGR